MGNPVMHWQILSQDPEKLEKFYTALFGWSISEANSLGYKQVDTGSGEGVNGGIWPIAPGQGHSMVQLFVRVDDVGSSVARAEQLGATIVIPPQTLPDGDEMAVAVDPEGIPFAIFRGAGSSPR
jgi:predicted enzyme related to lactoylglutathione lyase